MPSLEIANIQNVVLKHAAKVADLNGNTAFNGKLDSGELTVFIREAVKSGCNPAEITGVCNQVGVETDDVKTSMEKLNELQELREKIDHTLDILMERSKEGIKTDALYLGTCIAIGSIVVAALSGLIGPAATALACAPAVTAAECMSCGAVIGAITGAIVSFTNLCEKSHEKQPYERQLTPIEKKWNELLREEQEIVKSL